MVGKEGIFNFVFYSLRRADQFIGVFFFLTLFLFSLDPGYFRSFFFVKFREKKFRFGVCEVLERKYKCPRVVLFLMETCYKIYRNCLESRASTKVSRS